MPSKQSKGYNPEHDIEYTAGRRVRWKNDLAIGLKGEDIVKNFLKCLDNNKFEVKYDQYRNRQDGRGSGTKPWPQRMETIWAHDYQSHVVGLCILATSVHCSRS
jgi:hypothetical protein